MVETDTEIQRTVLIRMDAHHYHTVCERGKSRTDIGHSVHFIACRGRSVGDVQVTIEVGDVFMSGKVQKKASHRQVGHTVLAGKEIGIDHALCLPCLALENQLAYNGEDIACQRIVIVMRLSGPKGFFVELEFLVSGSTIHHRTQAGVSYGERVRPILGRTAIP